MMGRTVMGADRVSTEGFGHQIRIQTPSKDQHSTVTKSLGVMLES